MGNRKRRPIINFQTYIMLEFIDLVRLVIKSMTNNVHFTDPKPTLASLSVKVEDLATKELITKGGTTADTADMNDARTALEKEMVKLGMYIYIASDGDETIMLSSSFPLTADESAPATRPLLKLRHGGNPGEIVASCKAVPKAESYVWMYYVGENEPENEDDWKFSEATTQVKKTYKKLPLRAKVWARVCGVTPKGMTPWVGGEHIVVL